MAITTVNELVELVGASRLLDPAQKQLLTTQLQRQFTDARSLANAIVKRGWLTEYQIKMIANHKGGDLFFGPYVILDLLGAGGMGQVFKARQQKLDRVVALKVIRKERLSNTDAVRRFQREMRTASQLAHPNIVLALDAGQVGEHPFIAMEYVEGVDLARLVKQQGALPMGQACDYAAQAALGLQHAVERGLVHRDIKPSNLILTRPGPQGAGLGQAGVVKILDMGLARATESTQTDMSGTLTHAGAVIGTPDYISPEQARDSRTVDIRADLYSLGCTLYYLLTAQVPFPGGTPMEKLFKHQLEMPTPVEKLRPDLPGGVAQVVARLLAKDPTDRAQTPAEAARLLQPFAEQARANAAIQGGRPQRNQALKPTLAAGGPEVSTDDLLRKKRTSGLLASGAPAPLAPALDASPLSPRRRLRVSRRVFVGMAVALLVVVGSAIYLSLGGSTPATGPGGDTRPGVVQGTERLPPGTARTALDQLDPARIPAADRAGLPPELVAVFGQQRFRHWGPIQAVGYNADGTLLATLGGDRQVRLWNAATGEQRAAFPIEVGGGGGPMGHGGPMGFGANVAVFGKNPIVMALVPQQGFRAWDANSGRQVMNLPSARLPGRPLSLAPDGRALVWLDPGNNVKLIEMPKLEEHATLAGVGGNTLVAWAPDGTALATWARAGAGGKMEVKVWDAQTGQERRSIAVEGQAFMALALAPGGQRLAVAISPNALKLYNAATGEEMATPPLPAQAHQIAFAANGQTLAYSLSDRIALRDVASGKDRPGPATGMGGMGGMLFSPDGRALATYGNWDPMLHLWDAATNQPLHGDFTLGMGGSMIFAPDGQTLVASSGFPRPNARLLDIASGTVRATLVEGQQMTTVLAVAPDSQTVLTRSVNSLTLWNMATGGQKQTVAVGGGNQFMSAAATPDGRTVFTYSQGGKFWDGTTLEPRAALDGFKGQFLMFPVLTADGRRLAAGDIQNAGGGDSRGRVRVWDAVSGKEIPLNLPMLKGSLTSVVLSPDGKWVAAGTTGGNIRLWDAATGQERLNVAEPAGGGARANFPTLAVSPAGDTLFTWSHQQMKLWDAASGRERATLPNGTDVPNAGVFAAGGKVLATADRSGRITLWNPATGAELRRLQLPGPVQTLTFAADGRHLATANANGTIAIFRLPGM